MKRSVRSVSATLLIAAASMTAFIAPMAAHAAQPSAAELQMVKDMLKDAIAAEKNGKCDDALAILKQAAAIKETAPVLFHSGECLAKTGKLRDALTAYERSVDEARLSKDKAILKEAPPKIEQLKARIPTVRLTLPPDVKGATVKIDDKDVPQDRIGAPIQLDPGDHTVSVTADGRKPFSQKLSLAEKDAADLSVDLPPVGSSQVATVDTSKNKRGPDTDQPAKTNRIPLGTWVAGSAAVALAIGGFVAYFAAGSAASDGEAACAGETSQAKCDAASQSARDSVHELDTAALLLWVGAGVGAGTAVAFYVLGQPKSHGHAPPPTGKATASPPVSARVVVDPRSVRLIGSF